MKNPMTAVLLITALPAIADDTRQLSAHEHGVGSLDIAIDGDVIAMAFRAPGADIVGFEYKAESDEDRAAVDVALRAFAAPLELEFLQLC